jgi:hypothetical protein
MLQINLAGENGAGEASHLGVLGFTSSEILTSMQNGSGNLELIGWTYKGGKIVRAGTATAGTAQEVALALIGRRAVTAVRSGSNDLLLISWDVPSGMQSITRLHDTGKAAGEASNIAIAAIGSNMMITAMRDGSGELLLICWRLNADGSISRLGESNPPGKPRQAGAVDLVTIVALANNLVVTAVRNGSGNLELIAWNISSDGMTIRRMDPSGTSAGTVGEIALTAYQDPATNSSVVITAVQNGAGNLLLIAWKVLEEGAGFERLGDTSMLPPNLRPGTASHISVSPSGFAVGNFLASMRRGTGDLELIDFTLNPNGSWTRNCDYGQAQGTDVTETKISSFFGHAVTAIRKADFLNVAVWDIAQQGQTAIPGTAELNEWFKSVLADPARAALLGQDWMKLIQEELPLTPQQKGHLAHVPEKDARELQEAIAEVVKRGGTIHFERESEQGPGKLIVQPKPAQSKTAQPETASAAEPDFSFHFFHCTFDANCRNWHCGWGPGKKAT